MNPEELTEIKKDLKNGESISQVCKEYNISFKELTEACMIREKQRKQITSPYITLHNRMYRVSRNNELYGDFQTLNQANNIVKLLIKHKWELEPREYMGLKYIHKIHNKYHISKSCKCKTKHIASFTKKEDAIKVRDKLIKFDWDLDYLPLICKQLGVKNG